MADKESYLEDEVLLLADSGEIPEVAYHASLYFLRDDPHGPRLALEESDCLRLKEQVVARYRWIILRDLDPANRDKRIYRGVARSKANWQRLHKFCRCHGFSSEPIRQEAATALLSFLEQEMRDTANGRLSAVNCCAKSLEELTLDLGLALDELPSGWQRLCPSVEP